MKDLTILDPKEFGIEEEKAIQVASSFNNKNEELLSYTLQYNEIIKLELTPENCKTAGDLRKKLVKVRTGISDVHKVEKAFYLAGGRFVDALKNKLTLTVEQMEEKLSEMEKHFEKLEAERKSKLKEERIAKLEPFGVDTQFISLADMTEEQFIALFENSKLAHETKLENERKAEAERLEAERLAEEKRQAELKAEQERIEAQRLENERLKKEAEKREAELALERKKQAEEQAKKDALAKAEQERLAKIAQEEKAKADKLAAELKAKEDAIKAEQEKEQERIEAEERDRLAKEKAALLAPDKEKVKSFAIEFGKLKFPDLSTKEGKEMSAKVNAEIEKLKIFINSEYKKMK